MRESLHNYCMRENRKFLLWEWDSASNFPLTPYTISYGSKQKVWWQCRQGHRWQAAVHSRTGNGSGCPVCAGKIALSGVNDLAARYPELARQWNQEKNGTLIPSQVLPGSHRTVWWICEKGHEWRAQIKSRVMGCGCPICANRKADPEENSLAACFPAIASQWHPTRNGDLSPRQVLPGTRRKVWWRCKKGHEWQASIASRTYNDCGCPFCAGKKVIEGENSFADRFPSIAAQWHPTRNGSLTPWQIPAGTNRKVWWLCDLGHAYQASVSARTTEGSSCPFCAGRKVLPGFNDLASREPELARQWHPTLNGTLTPEMVTAGSHRKVWWKCDLGHVWKAVIYSRTGPKGCGCPVCAGRTAKRYLKIPGIPEKTASF